MGSSGWPSFTYEAIDTYDYAPKGELLTGEVDFAVAPEIADLPLPSVGRDTAEIVKEAYEALANLRKLNDAGGVMEGLLLRTEALESSRIEGERTNVRRLFVIAAGAQEKPEAHMTYNNFTALKEALQYPASSISAGTIMVDHSTLMKRERFAGKLRTKAPEDEMCVAGKTLFDAKYVPLAPGRVSAAVDDLVDFANRELPILEKIAIVHAHFESIHPFLDGNGRTGRILSQRLLAKAGHRPLPISAAYYGILEEYYESFTAYQNGDVEPGMRIQAISVMSAARSILKHLHERGELMENWTHRTEANKPARKNVLAALKWIADNPAYTCPQMAASLEFSVRTARRITSILAEENIVSHSKLYSRKPGEMQPIWEVPEIYKIAENVELTAKKTAKTLIDVRQ